MTTGYPAAPPEISPQARGKPEIDWANWKDARLAAKICPTGAIEHKESNGQRIVQLDLGQCIFCGLCADVDKAIRITNVCECAAGRRDALVTSATYTLNPDGTHQPEIATHESRDTQHGPRNAPPGPSSALEPPGSQAQERITRLLGRSLHIREVDASPRHADMLLVTGPVTRNMELALRKTYDAMPAPRLVVAVGACGCSGGIFGRNYATRGGVDSVIPVDVYIPGCPPNPHALLHGILMAVGKLGARRG